MGIAVEFNPDLALRNIAVHRAGERSLEECIPEPLEVGTEYAFLKRGQRLYWLDGELPLVETVGSQRLSRPRASITILEAAHVKIHGETWTRGRYRVEAVYDPDDPTIHFEGFTKL